MVVGVATVFAAMAQEGLNVAEFFSDAYTGNPKVTLVSMSYDKVEKNGMRNTVASRWKIPRNSPIKSGEL